MLHLCCMRTPSCEITKGQLVILNMLLFSSTVHEISLTNSIGYLFDQMCVVYKIQ